MGTDRNFDKDEFIIERKFNNGEEVFEEDILHPFFDVRSKTSYGGVTYFHDGDTETSPKIISAGIKDYKTREAFTTDTSSDIGSITKQYTAATLLKLWDIEISSGGEPKFFIDGMQTKVSNFMPRLKERFGNSPESLKALKKWKNSPIST